MKALLAAAGLVLIGGCSTAPPSPLTTAAPQGDVVVPPTEQRDACPWDSPLTSMGEHGFAVWMEDGVCYVRPEPVSLQAVAR